MLQTLKSNNKILITSLHNQICNALCSRRYDMSFAILCLLEMSRQTSNFDMISMFAIKLRYLV